MTNIKMNDILKLYIISCHVDKHLTQETARSMFDVRIQAGAALTDKRICDLNDLDDCPESISDRNRRYSEATAMFWIGKHIDSDYVGIMHYRRRLDLSDEEYVSYIEQGADIITTRPTKTGKSIEDDYRDNHYGADWELFTGILKQKDPEEFDFYRSCFGTGELHSGNINVFKAEIYKEYCEWIFPILDEFYKMSPEKSDIYQHRDVGFIAERLSHLFVMKKKRDGYRIVEAGIKDLRSDEWDARNECDYSNPDAVFNACNRLYEQHRITQCGNVLGEAKRSGNYDDPRLRIASSVIIAGILERASLPQTLHEYLPAQYRTDLNALVLVWETVLKALKAHLTYKTEESRKLFEECVTMFGFSDIAIGQMARSLNI